METKNTQQEEVDLGKLFEMIGNGFKKLFTAVFNLFKAVFHNLMLFLIFIKKHILKLVIATILGGVLGYVLDLNKTIDYKSEMYLETNLGSGRQIYNQTNYLNNLIGEEDLNKLVSIFNINKQEAEMLTGFVVEPTNIENNMLVEYDYYMQHTDTIYTRGFEVENFKQRMTDGDYRFQTISAFSSNKIIFNKLNEGMINLIENKHYKDLLKIKNNELNTRKTVLDNNLKQIDSLRKRYKKVALLNAQNKGNSGTNINLTDKLSNRNKDEDLFRESNRILSALGEIDEEKVRNGFIVSVLSDFKIGQKYGGFLSKKYIRYAVLFFGLAFLTIVGLKFNNYLENYKK